MVNINNESLYCCCNIILSVILTVSSVHGQQNIIRTCPRPLRPENADLVIWDAPRKCDGKKDCDQKHGPEQYQEYDKVYFACKENFQLASQLPYNEMSATCGRNGQWFPKIDQLEKCVNISLLKKCNTPDVFRCKATGQCIPKLKRCNCDVDCGDGSDEKDCPKRLKVIYALPNGKRSSGIISSPGYPRAEDYPRQFNCVYQVETLPPNRIRVDFEEFDLPRRENKVCADYVQMASVHPQFLTFKKLRKKVRPKTPTKCGQNGFGMVYSNDATITINVALGYGHKNPVRHYRGISLSWEVKSERDFYRALHAVTNKEKGDSNYVVYSPNTGGGGKKDNDDDEKLYTFVLPMVIVCGALSLVVLFCLVRQFKKHASKDDCLSSSTSKQLSSGVKTTSFTLTENNLAKFDETHLQQQHDGAGHHASRLNSISSPCRRGVGGGPATKNVAAGKCGSSQNSDLPRYIMSYDIMPTTTNYQHSSFMNNNNNKRHSSLSSAHRSSSNLPPTRNSCSKSSLSTLDSGAMATTRSNHCSEPQRNKDFATTLSRQQQQQHQYSSQEYKTSSNSGSSDNTSSSLRHHNHQRAEEGGVGRHSSSCGGASQSTATCCSLCHQRRKNCNGGGGDRLLNYNNPQQKRRQHNNFSLRQHNQQQHLESSSHNSTNSSGEMPTPTTYSREIYEQQSPLPLQQPPLSSRHHYMESTYPPAVENSVLPVAAGDDRLVEQADIPDGMGSSIYTDWYPTYNEAYRSHRYHQQYPASYETSSPTYEDGFFHPETTSAIRYNNKDFDTSISSSLHRVTEKRKVIYLEQEICDTDTIVMRREGAFMMNEYGGDYPPHPRYLMNTDRTLGGSLICTH